MSVPGAFSGIASSANGSKLVAILNGGISISPDSGATWTLTSAPLTSWGFVTSSEDGSRLVAAESSFDVPAPANPGAIYVSADSGATWGRTSAPLQIWRSVSSSADGTKLIAACGSGPIYLSADSGANWFAGNLPDSTWFSVASSASGQKIVAAGNGGIYTSADSGISWVWNNVAAGDWRAVASTEDGNKLVAALAGGGIWTWQTKPTPSEALGILIELVERSALPAERQRPLLSSLEEASASFVRDQNVTCIQQLRSFEQKVQAQVTRSEPALAEELIHAAQDIRDALLKR